MPEKLSFQDTRGNILPKKTNSTFIAKYLKKSSINLSLKKYHLHKKSLFHLFLTVDVNDMMAPYWMYEELCFMVNSEGIFQMIWQCPIEVIETVNVDAQLKPFSDIQEIFEKMICIKYEPQAEYGKEGGEMNFDINRVMLSLHRIIE